eukprot:TRINITY_DN1254_c0_g1_i11.p1 TRINITY_DN1254_c0_g1~~TRINITY_DN1254_c0_g1_i11.p1  ORF type:complete len:196 (+),score=32.11 TRINITY_DN1254_c0_g1_i11:595-1182(+)
MIAVGTATFSSVVLNNVFDTQIGYAIYVHGTTGSYPFPVSLNKVLKQFAFGEINEAKDEARIEMENNSEYWKIRPMSEIMLEYARSDVLSLPLVHKQMKALMPAQPLQNTISQHSQFYTEQIRSMTDKELEVKRDLEQAKKQENASDRWFPTYGFPKWDQCLLDSVKSKRATNRTGVGSVCTVLKQQKSSGDTVS